MGRRRRKGVRLAKKRDNAEPADIVNAPHSFVIQRGDLGKKAYDLLLNFRKIMEPFTASRLKVRKQNSLKDFIHIAGPLNVSHLVIFRKSANGMYFRIAKLPHGPTLTFQIKEYSLMRDVLSSQKKPFIYEKLFEHPPLLVLNNFSGEGMHFKLMATTFQNMFPSININKTKLNAIRRCLLLNYNEDKTIDLRHYAIKVVPIGMSKAVKKLIQAKVPNLSNYQEVDDFLKKSGNLSESEVEMDTPANIVTLPQSISSRGNIASEKSAIRLFEIGPRIKLQLIKIEEGINNGEILFHEFVTKTPEEIEAIREKIKAKKHLKEKHRTQMQKNVDKKKDAAEKGNEVEDNDIDEDEENLKWYREEVGEEPDENILHIAKKRKASSNEQRPRKKVKFSENDNAPTNINKKKMKQKFSNDAKKHKYRGKFQDTKKGTFSGQSTHGSKKRKIALSNQYPVKFFAAYSSTEETVKDILTEARVLLGRISTPMYPICGRETSANKDYSRKLGWVWICKNKYRFGCSGKINPLSNTFFKKHQNSPS
ncbi:suppressor of SWI4 1 homolog [Nephila pilipes]|uniref:Suppressor of SWI4 1 homolog n=1 Tax=Nephila pilipes TaxID=299642 RepID=A0A8X6QH20_NEPPI|nr:suppressor of SWI4 1 homolog [Nephila pilipes]